MIRRVLVALATLVALPLAAHAQDGGRLDLVRQRGTLVVGVKADYPPWGMRDETGALIGFEPDLARNVADQLGVGLKLVPVTSANRLAKVEAGEVDLIIATMGDTPKRRAQAGLVEPNYYASGVNIVMREGAAISDWAALRDKPVCLTRGAYYNRILIERHGFVPVVFAGTRNTELGLKSGQCVGWVYDDTALGPRLADKERWAGYVMPLPSILVAPWAVAVGSKDRDGPWGRFISNVIVGWHRTGLLIDKQAEWKLPPSAFLAAQHDLWRRTNAAGDPVCWRAEDGRYPDGCIDRSFLESVSADTAPASGTVARMLDAAGIAFPPLTDPFSGRTLTTGIGLTLGLSLVAIVGSLVFGVAAGYGLHAAPRPVRAVFAAINGVFYLTPPILNLYLMLFGIGGWLATRHGLTLDPFWVAGAIFSLYAGGSNAVIVSAALDHARETAARDDGSALLPIALERGYGGLVANSVNIVKAVGIASAIAVPEIIFAATSIVGDQGAKTEMMNFLMLFYLLLVTVLVLALERTKTWVTRWTSARS